MEVGSQSLRAALLSGGSVDSVDPEALEVAESELVEEYLERSLSESESELFTENFLVTDDRRDLLHDLRLLKKVSSDSFVFDASEIDRAANQTAPRSAIRIGSVVLVLAVLAILTIIAWQLLRN